MPKCKNDPKRSYKGTEPSPKGNGWCAHSEKLGKVRKGTDGNMWIVIKIKNGSKRWIKKKNNRTKVNSNQDENMILMNTFLKKRSIKNKKDMKEFYSLLKKIGNKMSIKNSIKNRILKTKKQKIKQFNVTSKKMIITDPSKYYPKNNKHIYNVEPGKWQGYFHTWITDDSPNITIITNKKYVYPSKHIKYKLGGFLFVNLARIIAVTTDNYPRDKKTHKKWFDQVYYNHKVNSGYVTSTGWGDGMYRYDIGTKNRKVVQFIIYFIPYILI